MCDYREKFVNEACTNLTRYFEAEDLNRIRNELFIVIDNYELQERCTDLVPLDDENEQILKMYVGSILTEGKSKRTATNYVRVLRRFLDDTNKNCKDIEVSDIRVWLAKIQQKASARTAQTYRSYLSAFYQWLRCEEILIRNPVEKIKPIKYNSGIKIPFSDIEVDMLRSGCKTKRERAELELLLATGARVSEMCAMDIRDINFRSLEVYIREAKGSKSRTVYMTELCAVHLKNYLNERKDRLPCLFATRVNNRLSVASAEGDLHRIGRRAEVENVHPHRCRRTFATNNAKRGMSVEAIQKLMGHTNINTTMDYITLNNVFVRNEYAKYN